MSQPNETTEVHYVGFWARMLAFIIDNIVVIIITLPLSLTTNIDVAMLSDPEQSLGHLQDQLAGMSFKLLIAGIAVIGFWRYFAATPGKLLLKSYIVSESDLRAASNGQLIIRYLGYIPSLLFLGLGFAWIAFDGKKQSWHDKLAKTVVVYQKPVQS